MPMYSVVCRACGNETQKRLTFVEYDRVKSGGFVLDCPSCASPAEIAFDPGRVSFVLKEGESGGWASKSLKENAYRAKRRDEMTRREKNHVFKPSLQANYNGMETGSWREAQEVARKEKGVDAAASYDSLVAKEKT